MSDGGPWRPRVLVVEDEAIIAMHLQTVLQDAGWEVVGPVASRLAALRLARRCSTSACAAGPARPWPIRGLPGACRWLSCPVAAAACRPGRWRP